jgi:hypothetical protein
MVVQVLADAPIAGYHPFTSPTPLLLFVVMPTECGAIRDDLAFLPIGFLPHKAD